MKKDDFLRNKFLRELLINQAKAKPGPFELVLILDHLKSGPNIGKILRTAEVMGVKEVYIIGTKYFDPTPAKGAIKRIPLCFMPHFHEAYEKLHQAQYTFYRFDLKATQFLGQTHLSKKAAFILGHEGFGVMFDQTLYPQIELIKIPQFGSTQSLNVAQAAAMGIFEYARNQKINSSSDAPVD
jgi:23S rRNA (guanosine2251-2'-O)-methyltransferase